MPPFPPHRHAFGALARRASRLGLCIALSTAVAPQVAGAASAPTDAAGLAARGTKSFRAGDFARALTDFEEAATLVERGQGDEALLPVLRFNLGRCLEELGHPREAIDAFERYLETPDSETARARATDRITALESRYFARLQLDCAPKNAKILLAGKPAGACGQPLKRLAPGPVEVTVVAPAGPSVTANYTLQAGVETHASVTVPGRLQVMEVESPGAHLEVDGAPVAGPPTTTDVEPGLRRVVLVHADGRRSERDVKVLPGAQVLLGDSDFAVAQVAPDPGGRGGSAWPWVAYGASAVAAGLGVYYWASAYDSADDARAAARRYNTSSDPNVHEIERGKASSALDAVATDRAVAYTLVGGAFVLAGLGTYLIWPRTEAAAPQAVGIGPTGAVWRTSF